MAKLQKVHIEITNVCNLKCSFCPAVDRDAQFMAPDAFEKVLLKVKDHTQWVCLHLMGEPTVHPQFAKIVELCHFYQKKVYLVTNGLLMPKHLNLLQGQGYFHQINFSLQSYWDNFPERDIRPYLETLTKVSSLTLKNEPQTYVNFRFWDRGSESEKSKQAIQSILEHYNLPLDADSLLKGEAFDQNRKRFLLAPQHYLHFDQRFAWPSRERNPDYGPKGRCHALKTHAGVLVDGTVVPCCLDSEGELALGKLLKEPATSFADILGGSRAQKLRHGFSQGERVEDLCRHCDFINRFQ